MEAILTIFWGLIVLILLVVVHELGHFIAARLFGVRVTEFMIGLPGPGIGFDFKGTRFGVTCIPLGGYNRITGMEGGEEDPNLEVVLTHVFRQGKTDVEHTMLACNLDEEDAKFALDVLDEWGSINKPGRSNDTDFWCAPKTDEYALGEPRIVEDSKALLDFERSQTYRGLSFPKRLVTLFAGPLMNGVLAVILVLVMLCGMGVPYASSTIAEVGEGSAAERAGIVAEDTVIAMDGYQIDSAGDLSAVCAMHQVGDEVAVIVQRGDQQVETVLTLQEGEQGRPMLGVIVMQKRMRLGPVQALKVFWDMFATTVMGYVSLFNPATAADTLSQSSSVVGIAVMAKQAAGQGMWMFLYLLAAISLSLGVVNLLPVVPLDGGKIICEIVERIIGRPVSVRVINTTTVIVMALLILLFIYMVNQDVHNFILGARSIFG